MDITKPTFKKTQVITDKVAELLIRQISRELYNHNLYNTFSSYFSIRGLYKLEEYYRARANEELNHHIWIRDYLQLCNVPFAYPQVDAVEIEIPDDVAPFQQTIDAEIETTEWINEIYASATELEDQQTKKWLAKLEIEQSEEESLSLKVYQLATIDCDWITKQDAIIDFYNKNN
jgi:ferritin